MSNTRTTRFGTCRTSAGTRFQPAGVSMIRFLVVVIATLHISLSFTSVTAAYAEDANKAPRDDVIAKVGDQSITFNQINTMLNSSAIVGLSIPELGTPERDQVRLTLLDKAISANLIYLDAVEKGTDKDPGYQRDLERFSDSMLALAYKRRYLAGQTEVTDQEIQTFFENNIPSGTELTDEVKTGIAAKLRTQKLALGAMPQRQRLREGVQVDINVTELDPSDDAVRDDTDVVAELDGSPILWGGVKGNLSRPVNAVSVDRRISALDEMIDNRIMVAKGRAAGLEKDPAYLRPYNEFKKVRLINLHRGKLVAELAPSDQEVREYYAQHRDQIMIKQRRKVQIVVLESEEDAEAVKQLLEAGTITMYQAAAEHSVLPGSKKTLGEIGWVSEGTGFAGLDKLTFSLGPGEIGGPVETPNGWHLVKVQDMEEAVYADIEEERTYRMTRRKVVKQRLNVYVVALREKSFPVEVYDDKLSYHMQKEVDWYKIKSETGTQPPEKIYREIDKLRGVEATGAVQ